MSDHDTQNKVETIKAHCPAKLNLALHVGPPDQNDPHHRHPVASWMVGINLADTLHITPRKQGPSQWAITFANDAPQPQLVDWPLEQDLAFRAHAAVQETLGHELPIEVRLTKRIPAGAGLGGGSADAAGILAALQHLPPAGSNDFDAIAIAQQLGSDVAFALQCTRIEASDNHTNKITSTNPENYPELPGGAIATGFGEQLETLPASEHSLHAALILPDFTCPTASVYRVFDELNPSKAPHAHAGLRPDTAQQLHQLAAHTTDLASITDNLHNDLTPAACHAQPKLRELFGTLHHAKLTPKLTGSGSAVFLPAHDAKHAAQLAEQAHQLTALPALAVTTSGR